MKRTALLAVLALFFLAALADSPPPQCDAEVVVIETFLDGYESDF